MGGPDSLLVEDAHPCSRGTIGKMLGRRAFKDRPNDHQVYGSKCGGRWLDAIAAWGEEKVARDKQRMQEGLQEAIPVEDLKGYHAVMKDMLLKYEEKKPPAMPCYGIELDREDKTSQSTSAGEGLLAVSNRKKGRAQESRLDYLCEEASEELYALIHTAIPDKKVYEIPGAKAAVVK